MEASLKYFLIQALACSLDLYCQLSQDSLYLNSREHNRSEKGRSALGGNDHRIKTNTNAMT